MEQEQLLELQQVRNRHLLVGHLQVDLIQVLLNMEQHLVLLQHLGQMLVLKLEPKLHILKI